MVTRVLVINTPGLFNRGGMGVVMGALRCLKENIADAHITFLCHHWEADTEAFQELCKDPQIAVKKHPWYQERGSKLATLLCCGAPALFSLLYCALCRISSKLRLPFKNVYQDCDLIIDLNVDSLNECYQGIFAPFFVLFNILLGLVAGKPVVVLAASIVLFRNRVIKFLAKIVLNKVDLITVREEASRDNLRALGVNKPEIHLTADLAFLLEPAPVERLDRILKDEGIKRGSGPFIGVAFHKFISGSQDYVQLMANITDTLIEDLNATIIYVPHTFETSRGRIVISTTHERIYRQVKNKHKVKLIHGKPLADELKGIIGMCDMFISFMFHPMVASTSLAIPSIPIMTYGDYKFHEILGKAMGQEEYIVDFINFDCETLQTSLKSKVNYVWANRDSISKELRERSKVAKEQALLNGSLVKDLLQKISQ